MTIKGQLTYIAHLYKAIFRQHHKDLFYTNMAPLIAKDGIVIDIGGHAGQFSKLFSKYLGTQGYVYSFEPGHYALSILRKVKSIKRLNNLEIVPKALGARREEAQLHIPVKKSGSLGFGLSSIARPEDNNRKTVRHKIEIITLDDFVDDKKLQRLDFIKIDIEGGEYDFLKGAEKTLEQFRPAILMEINGQALARHNANPQDIDQFMRDLGYESYILQQGEFTKIPPPIPQGDILWKKGQEQ